MDLLKVGAGEQGGWRQAMAKLVLGTALIALAALGIAAQRADRHTATHVDEAVRSHLALAALTRMTLAIGHASSAAGQLVSPSARGRGKDVHPDYAGLDEGLSVLWRLAADNAIEQVQVARIHAVVVDQLRAAGHAPGWWKAGGLPRSEPAFQGERLREVWQQLGSVLAELHAAQWHRLELGLQRQMDAQRVSAGLRAGIWTATTVLVLAILNLVLGQNGLSTVPVQEARGGGTIPRIHHIHAGRAVAWAMPVVCAGVFQAERALMSATARGARMVSATCRGFRQSLRSAPVLRLT